MAAVGMNWDEAQAMCQRHPGVSTACNNAADNVTVSGTAEAVTKFVDELKTRNVFAKEVKSYGIAFHSPAMQKAAPIYLQVHLPPFPHYDLMVIKRQSFLFFLFFSQAFQ